MSLNLCLIGVNLKQFFIIQNIMQINFKLVLNRIINETMLHFLVGYLFISCYRYGYTG